MVKRRERFNSNDTNNTEISVRNRTIKYYKHPITEIVLKLTQIIQTELGSFRLFGIPVEFKRYYTKIRQFYMVHQVLHTFSRSHVYRIFSGLNTNI